ncbi:unnamed protein product [Trichobilharzia regenti]|nr:unnamed protein product [Trichobilharzia regenti]
MPYSGNSTGGYFSLIHWNGEEKHLSSFNPTESFLDLNFSSLDEGFEAPHFLKELTSITVVEGSAARFETCARGQPAPTIRWLKDGKPLLTDGVRTNTSNSGTYTCIAASSAGTAITEAAFQHNLLLTLFLYITNICWLHSYSKCE